MPVYFSSEGMKYNPYTLDDLLKPLEKYKTAYDALEKKYESLSLTADNFKAQLDPSLDKNAYEIVSQYRKHLDESQKDMMTNGLPSAMQGLINLRNERWGPVQQVSDAYDKRVADIKRAQKLTDKGHLISYDPSLKSLDEYMAGTLQPFNSIDAKNIVLDAKSKMSLLNGQFSDSHNYGGISQNDVYLAVQTTTPGKKYDKIRNLRNELIAYYVNQGYDEESVSDAVDRGLVGGAVVHNKPQGRSSGTKPNYSANVNVLTGDHTQDNNEGNETQQQQQQETYQSASSAVVTVEKK